MLPLIGLAARHGRIVGISSGPRVVHDCADDDDQLDAQRAAPSIGRHADGGDDRADTSVRTGVRSLGGMDLIM